MAAVYNRAAPGDGTLPLRLLNNFYLYVRDPDSGAERAAGLEELHNGEPLLCSYCIMMCSKLICTGLSLSMWCMCMA